MEREKLEDDFYGGMVGLKGKKEKKGKDKEKDKVLLNLIIRPNTILIHIYIVTLMLISIRSRRPSSSRLLLTLPARRPSPCSPSSSAVAPGRTPKARRATSPTSALFAVAKVRPFP